MCIDKKEREKILLSDNSNILVDASAGTGKTTIMVEKALLYIRRSSFRHYQKIVMLTFTRFATQQIRDKVIEYKLNKGIEDYQVEIYTNNGFVLAEVIRPFLREAYGKKFPDQDEIEQDFSQENKFYCWNDGINQLQNRGVLGSYIDIKKDFTFELALRVLKKSKNAQKYIKVKYPAMFLDEYQDTSPEMHDFFMYLKDELNISLFIVGDIKQAIFGFRGANPDLFKSLYSKGFTSFELINNFRSDLTIVKYANYFLGQPLTQKDFEGGVFIEYHLDWSKKIVQELKNISDETTVVYLVNSPRKYEEIITKLESNHGFVYMDDPPLSTKYPNYDVLYPLLLLYHDRNNYNLFDLFNDIGLQKLQRYQKTMNNIQGSLEKKQIKEALNFYSNLIERNFSNSEIENFENSMEKKWRVQFCKMKPRKQIMTIHKSKGLDFDIVFIDAKSFYYKDEFQEQNHYVAITRPRKKLFINLNHMEYVDLLSEIVS